MKDIVIVLEKLTGDITDLVEAKYYIIHNHLLSYVLQMFRGVSHAVGIWYYKAALQWEWWREKEVFLRWYDWGGVGLLKEDLDLLSCR